MLCGLTLYVSLSLEEFAEPDCPQRVGVLARRRPRQEGHVLIPSDGMPLSGPTPFPYGVLDHEVSSTPDEAERLGQRLIASARNGTGGRGVHLKERSVSNESEEGRF